MKNNFFYFLLFFQSMKNELFNLESNFSRLGKFFVKKYLYLFNRKDYLSNLKKILAARREKEKTEDLTFNDDIFNSTSKLDKNIFDINYENNHDKIIEAQMKKYLEHKNKYKFHSIHINSNNKRKKEVKEEPQKLILSSTINTENKFSLSNRKKDFNSFDKILGRNETKVIKRMRSNKNNDKNFGPKKIEAKDIEILKMKRNNNNNNNLIKQKNSKKNYKTINKNKIIYRELKKCLSENNNFPSIPSSNNLTTIETTKSISPRANKNSKVLIRKIHLNNKLKNKLNSIPNDKNYFSLDNSRHIRSINFSKMLSRKNKQTKLNRITSIFNPLTPNYDSIYPKTIINFLYKDKIQRKDFSPKYRKYNHEFFLDLDKVYNKYNNHKEVQSFSLDKNLGRKDLFNQEIKDLSKLNKEEITEIKTNDIKINKEVFNIMNLYINNNLTSKNLNHYGYKANDDFLENIYKQIIKNILNKEKKTIEEARLKKIISGNKINSNYKKLFNIFIEHKFLNDLNDYQFPKNL